MHEKSEGHEPAALTSQFSTHSLSFAEVPTHWSDRHSAGAVHVSPRPPGTSGPGTQTPITQTSSPEQPLPAVHGGPMSTSTIALAGTPWTSIARSSRVCAPSSTPSGAVSRYGAVIALTPESAPSI